MTSRSSLEILTLRQLRNKAMELEIARHSHMTKDQLLVAIQEAEELRLRLGTLATPSPQGKEKTASAKFHAGGVQESSWLTAVDEDLGDLPEGYGESRIVLLPRDPNWAYAYWDIPNDHKEALRQQGGKQLALRLYEVTDIPAEGMAHSVKEYPCDELAREWYLPIPVSDRAYYVEIGYRCEDSSWLPLARSTTTMLPPTHPSDWIDEHFMTVPFDLSLHGKTLYQLWDPQKRVGYPQLGLVAYQGTEVQRPPTPVSTLNPQPQPVDPYTVFGSHQLSFKANASGMGLAASQVEGLWISTGVELTLYGFTHPQATVWVEGKPQKLNPDGTFRLRLDLCHGETQVPIRVAAQDQEQNHTLYIRLEQTPPLTAHPVLEVDPPSHQTST